MSGLSKRKVVYLYDRTSSHCLYLLLLTSIYSGYRCIHIWTRTSHETTPDAYDARVGHGVWHAGADACASERTATIHSILLTKTFPETKTRKPGGNDRLSHR